MIHLRRYSTGGLGFAKNKESMSSNQLIESLSLSNYMGYVMNAHPVMFSLEMINRISRVAKFTSLA